MALNRITIMGRICNDIELRRTATGKAVTSFALAVDRDFKSDNGEKKTDFIECVAWGNTAEFVSKYFGKGRMAIASGRLQIRSWEDKNGNKRKTAEVVADNVYFGDSKNDSKPQQESKPSEPMEPYFGAMMDDDFDFPWDNA